ncbi:MAG: hypothetical protein WBF42_07405 [Terracidiphilus sp.]
MDLLERYLQAVKKYLPWKRQDDIIAELRANLEAQLEEKEEEKGRPLTQSEAEEWLKQMGSPIQMAARYQPQQYLIGPALFPVYWYVLKLVIFWAVAVYLIVSGVQLAVDQTAATSAAVQAVFRIPSVLVQSAAWVTLVFAALELVAKYYPAHMPKEIENLTSGWSPAGLPPLEHRTGAGEKRRSYAQAVAEVVVGFVFLAWMLLIPKHPILMLGPGMAFMHATPFQLAPVWWHFYWCLVGLCMLQLVWHGVDLLRGSWLTPSAWQNIVSKTIGLIAIWPIVAAPGHVVITLKHPEIDMAQYGATLHSMNEGIHMAMTIAAVIVVLQLVYHIAQLGMETYRRGVAGSQA